MKILNKFEKSQKEDHESKFINDEKGVDYHQEKENIKTKV